MATDERKQNIKEHLAKSTNNMDFERTPQNYDPSESAPSTPDAEKKRKEEHLNRTKGEAATADLNTDERKRQVMDHVDITKG